MSLPVRLSGIPNNATLELRQSDEARVEGNVTVCLQFESSGRVIGEFASSTTLWHIIESLKPDYVAQNAEQAVTCIYMRNEVHSAVNEPWFIF